MVQDELRRATAAQLQHLALVVPRLQVAAQRRDQAQVASPYSAGRNVARLQLWRNRCATKCRSQPLQHILDAKNAEGRGGRVDSSERDLQVPGNVHERRSVAELQERLRQQRRRNCQ
jgi:hypothetical protein